MRPPPPLRASPQNRSVPGTGTELLPPAGHNRAAIGLAPSAARSLPATATVTTAAAPGRTGLQGGYRGPQGGNASACALSPPGADGCGHGAVGWLQGWFVRMRKGGLPALTAKHDGGLFPGI